MRKEMERLRTSEPASQEKEHQQAKQRKTKENTSVC
jgi:hypothetical protein